jgi:hypothetical protein
VHLEAASSVDAVVPTPDPAPPLADPAHARKHASIDRLLSALELIPEDA